MVETTLRVIRVFIGSPGGLDTERQTAKSIIDEINQSHAEHWGCQIKLVGWEATLPGYSRAQSLINQDLDKCDYFVGILWNHWGSKPDDGNGKYSSGFEEEFERAKTHLNDGFMKDIALYFKDIDEAQIKDPGPSLRKVLDFREKCIKARRPLFKQFAEPQEFGRLFRAKIEEIGWQEYQALQARAKDVIDAEQPAKGEKKLTDTPNTSLSLIGESSARFVGELLRKPGNWDATDCYEVARLRLIALSTFRTGNDHIYLGNHDANLMFLMRNHYDFHPNEIRALTDAGISGLDHQNLPLWAWIAASGKYANMFGRVTLLAAVGALPLKANAIRILQCTDQETPELNDVIDRKMSLSSWLIQDNDEKTFKAAVEFLKTNGVGRDLEIIESLTAQVPEKRKSAVIEAIVLICAKTDTVKAFQKVIDLDPDTMGNAGASMLFANAEAVPTPLVARCVKLKAESIRRKAALALQARDAIDVPTAETLLADPDLDTRLVAIETLVRHGVNLPDGTIRSALIQQPRQGLFGFGYPSRPDDSYYQLYRRNRLSQLGYEDLRKRAEGCDLFENLEILTLYSQYTRRCGSEIREHLRDQFKGYFERKLALTTTQSQYDANRIAEVQRLEGYLRTVLTSRTVDILCGHGAREDLSLVRATLDECEVTVSTNILNYISRYGNWSDVQRVLTLARRRFAASNFLWSPSDEWVPPIAHALYHLGNGRLGDLLQLETDNAIKRAVILKFTQRDMAKLGDGLLIEQLNSADDQLRKAVAIKCALALTQTRVNNLLERYIQQSGQRYYNSIHWLDLGASMARSVVKVVAKFELANLV